MGSIIWFHCRETLTKKRGRITILGEKSMLKKVCCEKNVEKGM